MLNKIRHHIINIIIQINLVILLAWEAMSEKNQSTCHYLFVIIREVSALSKVLDNDSPLRMLHLCQMFLFLHEILIRKDVLLLVKYINLIFLWTSIVLWHFHISVFEITVLSTKNSSKTDWHGKLCFHFQIVKIRKKEEN